MRSVGTVGTAFLQPIDAVPNFTPGAFERQTLCVRFRHEGVRVDPYRNDFDTVGYGEGL